MSAPSHRNRRKGFTLLEIMLASAVMAVIALSLYSALRIAMKARDSTIASVAPARSAELAMSVVSQDLESALWPTGTLAGAFIGGPGSELMNTHQLEFYAVLPSNSIVNSALANSAGPNIGGTRLMNTVDPTLYAGVCRVDFLVRQLSTDAQPVLVRRITRNLLSTTDPVTEDQVLCRGVRSFTATYFTSAEDGQETSYDTWDSTQQGDSLPLCVEITLELEPIVTANGDPAREDGIYRTTHLVTLACYRQSAQGGAL